VTMRVLVAGVAATVAIAGGLLGAGVTYGHTAARGWQPGAITNVVLEAGPGVAMPYGEPESWVVLLPHYCPQPRPPLPRRRPRRPYRQLRP
jgi:hypothetical protein